MLTLCCNASALDRWPWAPHPDPEPLSSSTRGVFGARGVSACMQVAVAQGPWSLYSAQLKRRGRKCQINVPLVAGQIRAACEMVRALYAGNHRDDATQCIVWAEQPVRHLARQRTRRLIVEV